MQGGTYTNVQTNPPIATSPGAALGSIDQSLALVSGASNGTNKILSIVRARSRSTTPIS